MAIQEHNNLLMERPPNNHKFDLQQFFDTCRGCIVTIAQSLQLKRPVLYRRLDAVNDTLQSLSSDFCSASQLPDNCAYLLIVILQKIHEILRNEIDSSDTTSQLFEPAILPAAAGSTPVTILGHGELHVLIEGLVDSLDVSEDEVDRIEEYVFRVQRYIHRATRHTSPLERLVSQTESWNDQLIALSLYTFHRHSFRLSDSVILAQERIKTVLDMRDLQ